MDTKTPRGHDPGASLIGNSAGTPIQAHRDDPPPEHHSPMWLRYALAESRPSSSAEVLSRSVIIQPSP